MSTDVKVGDGVGGDVSKLNRKNSLVGENGKMKKSPFGQLLDAVAEECIRMGLWNEDLQRDLPKKWEKHGDMILLPEICFTRQEWRMLGKLCVIFRQLNSSAFFVIHTVLLSAFFLLSFVFYHFQAETCGRSSLNRYNVNV